MASDVPSGENPTSQLASHDESAGPSPSARPQAESPTPPPPLGPGAQRSGAPALAVPSSPDPGMAGAAAPTPVQVSPVRATSLSAPPDEFSESVDAQLSELLDRNLGGQALAAVPTAPIVVPDSSQLVLKVIPLHLFERLEDSDSDRSVVSALLWALVGLAGGLLITSLQDIGATTSATWALLCVFVIACLFTGFYYWRLNSRHKRMIEAIKDNKEGPAK